MINVQTPTNISMFKVYGRTSTTFPCLLPRDIFWYRLFDTYARSHHHTTKRLSIQRDFICSDVLGINEQGSKAISQQWRPEHAGTKQDDKVRP